MIDLVKKEIEKSRDGKSELVVGRLVSQVSQSSWSGKNVRIYNALITSLAHWATSAVCGFSGFIHSVRSSLTKGA